MRHVQVGRLTFGFADPVAAEQYEVAGKVVGGWPIGAAVVDIVAVDGAEDGTAWLIEVKDFRQIDKPPQPANLQDLPATVERKVRGTLLGLRAITTLSHHRLAPHAGSAGRAACTRIVLHAEPYPRGGVHSKLFPVGFPVGLHQKLRSLVRDIDPDPLILTLSLSAASGVPWSVQ